MRKGNRNGLGMCTFSAKEDQVWRCGYALNRFPSDLSTCLRSHRIYSKNEDPEPLAAQSFDWCDLCWGMKWYLVWWLDGFFHGDFSIVKIEHIEDAGDLEALRLHADPQPFSAGLCTNWALQVVVLMWKDAQDLCFGDHHRRLPRNETTWD